MKHFMSVLAVSVLLVFLGCGKKESSQGNDPDQKKESGAMAEIENEQYLSDQLTKLAPVEISCPLEGLDEGDQKALPKIIAAAALMDSIFLRQVYSRNVELLEALRAGQSERHKKALEYFQINFGPFDRINQNKPFIGTATKPDGANFYPEDMSKDEFLAHLKANPNDEAAFSSNFTMIRRENSVLTAVPYSVFFATELEKAALLMNEAALLTENESLRRYLISRAEAFRSNDYRQSDMDWMDLSDHDLEVVIGPYEVYEDALFGYKAAFESFITRVDREDSAKLVSLSGKMDELERNLPIDDQYKNFSRGKSSPIIVANVIYTAGDTKAGVQTTAFNLPNDEFVREAKGSKKVMLKNIARAKFDNCWIPIVQELLGEEDLKKVSFDAYFNHVLLHEIAHGLGPGNIKKEGRETTVNRELKELYSVIEEAKADILGLWNLLYLVNKGEFAVDQKDKIFSTYLGGIFRSVRFGIGAAHGGANAIQLNYILDQGGFGFDEEQVRYYVNADRMMEAVRALSHELLMIQARGDYDAARVFIDRYRRVDERLQKALDRAAHVPIDIRPRYAAESYLSQS